MMRMYRPLQPTARTVNRWLRGPGRRLLVIGLALWACAGQAALPKLPVIVTQVPVGAGIETGAEAVVLRRSNGFAGSRLVRLTRDGHVEVLTQGFAAACDPNVSFDGQHLLFAGKRLPGDSWSIWEMDMASGRVRSVTAPGRDCRSPIYVSSLYTLDSPEPWYTILYVGVDDTLDVGRHVPSSSLYLVKLDGTETRRVTFNPGSALDPHQMPDNRVVFGGWRGPRLGSDPERGRLSLFAAHIDGTDLELYGGAQAVGHQQMICSTASGQVVFVESEGLMVDGAGQLARVREQRPHHSYERITDDPRHAYLYPSVLEGDILLVSRRETSSVARAGVVQFDLQTRRVQPVFDDPDYHDLQAVVVRPRPEPDGRSTVVNLKYDTGVLYCLNAYDTDARWRRDWGRGMIDRLRVIEGVPLPKDSDPSAQPGAGGVPRRILGEVPVDADGSFNIQLPADLPIELQALDADGLALKTCGWIWVKQRETRGCIGCHEDPELTPENRFVEAVRRSGYRLTLPPERRRTVTFRDHVWPILKQHCATADCHGGQESPLHLPRAQGVNGETAAVRQAYENVMAADRTREPAAGSAHGLPRYVTPGRARTSYLIWQVLGRNTARPWDSATPDDAARVRKVRQMPPSDHPTQLSEAEMRTLIEWIDLGAPMDFEEVSTENQ